MFRLDYISCLLTIVSTIMVGRRMWQGWIVAGANSAIICAIALRTTQTGFIPANLFCMAIYIHNIAKWKHEPANESASVNVPSNPASPMRNDVVRVNDANSAVPENEREADSRDVAQLLYRC